MSVSKSDRTEQRRRILRGAVSAPVIFTLPSGAALAQVSTSCAAKSQELAATENPLGIATGLDKWMRFEVEAYSFNGSVKVSGFLDATTAGSGTTPANKNDRYFQLNGLWYRYNVADGTAMAVTLSTPTPSGTPVGPLYVLVDYAAYSAGTNPTMYVYPARTPVINPIAGASCWNSLTGASLTETVIN
jgi:hypothetical protein